MNEYKEFFTQLEIETYRDFVVNNKSETLVAGTIMSIQEKKSSKGTSFAIIKFSDNHSEFELFMFSDLLTLNRDKLKESNSFVLTLHKEKAISETIQRRINVRKIVDLSELVNKTYESVSIELNDKNNLKELSNLLVKSGKTKINILLSENSKNYKFELGKNRKFDFNLFTLVKNKQYIKKIRF